MKPDFACRLLLVSAVLLTCSLECTNAQLGNVINYESALHYNVSAGISFAACRYLTVKKPEISVKNRYLLAGSIGLLAGVGKEVLDIALGSYFSAADFVFDLLGIVSGLDVHYQIFDNKKVTSNISFIVSGRSYLASIIIFF
jgi:hypothetical protein